MITENIPLFFLLNVIVLSTAIAILEIIIEKDAGWGANLPKDKWYGKIIGKDNFLLIKLAKLLGVPYFFGYGILMYFFLLPLVLLTEFFITRYDLLFFFAIFALTTALEDFLWFVFNWNFNSLTELLRGPHGKIWWHQKWVKIWPNKYLPRSYFIAAALTAILLLLVKLKNGV